MTNQPKNLGRALEHRIANRAKDKGLDAERHYLSGMMPGLKGDGHIEDVLYEAKVRTANISARGEKSLTIPLTDLRKVQADAVKGGFTAGIMVANAKGDTAPLVICDLDYFLGLLALVKQSSAA